MPYYLLLVFSPFTAGRYHSLVIEKDTFPHEELEITAWTEDGLVMAARHKKHKYLQVTYKFVSQFKFQYQPINPVSVVSTTHSYFYLLVFYFGNDTRQI